MSEIKGNRVLSGTWAQMWYNGFLIGEMTKITTKVTVNREDVQVGIDVDTKMTGMKGEGTISLAKAFTRFEDVREELSRGRDPRGIIITKLKDPDATGAQTERYQIGNVALSEFGFEWEKGSVVKQDYPFSFTPSDMILLDKINEE
ncbi:MAG: phage tail tube protein [Lachnospiraceae bacterium]|nr:phage tail tube protein [Lachnospiraceae bacterium]